VTGTKVVTAAARREAVQCLRTRGLSQRQACVLLPLPRSTLSYRERPDRHAELAQPLYELAHRYPRDG
jgi:hypothetical protein